MVLLWEVQEEVSAQLRRLAAKSPSMQVLDGAQASALVTRVCLCTSSDGGGTPLVDGEEALGEAVSLDTLLVRVCTDIGPAMPSDAQPLAPLEPAAVAGREVRLLLPDDEASEVASSKPDKRLLRGYSEQVWKLRSNWIKNWKKQCLTVGAGGVALSKQASSRERSVIALEKIESASVAVQEDVGPKVRLRAESFVVRTRDGRAHVLASEAGGMSAAKWCKVIVTHALLQAVHGNAPLERVARFCELGADVNVALPDGRQYPPLALALTNGAWEAAKYLLRRGADPSCLLRWSFLMVDKVTTPVRVLELLIETQKDLNVCSDDVHGWSLLHYLAFEGDLESVRQLIARVDVPTIQAVNTLGDCSLMLALKRHPEEPPEAIIKLCLALGKSCDVTRRDKWNDTTLHLAIRKGHLQLAKRLIELGAKIEELDSAGDNALHIAMKSRAFGLAQWMVEKLGPALRGPTLNKRDDKCGDTVLALAIKLGTEDVALFFLRHGADWSVASRAWGFGPTCVSDSPLHIAIKMGMRDLAVAMVRTSAVESGGDGLAPAELRKRDTMGVPPLVLALQHGMLRLALVVIKAARAERPETATAPPLLGGGEGDGQGQGQGGDGEGNEASTPPAAADTPTERGPEVLDMATTADGISPLQLAVRKGLFMLASTLVDAGADANAQDKGGYSVLHTCVEMLAQPASTDAHAAVVLRFMSGLLSRNRRATDPRLRAGDFSHTPLHLAVLRGLQGPASLLLSTTAGLADDCDRNGNSALSLAIKRKDLAMTRLLVSHGANVNVVNHDNHCPLHIAVRDGSREIVLLLLEKRAYPGVWDSRGRCPVHVAAQANAEALLRILARHCTEPGHLELRTEDGHSALMLAVRGGCLEAVRALVESGVDLRARVPGSRVGVMHIAADLCLGKAAPFWGSGVAEYLVELPAKDIEWDRSQAGVTSADAVAFIRRSITQGLEGPEEPAIASGVDAEALASGPDDLLPVAEPFVDVNAVADAASGPATGRAAAAAAAGAPPLGPDSPTSPSSTQVTPVNARSSAREPFTPVEPPRSPQSDDPLPSLAGIRGVDNQERRSGDGEEEEEQKESRSQQHAPRKVGPLVVSTDEPLLSPGHSDASLSSMGTPSFARGKQPAAGSGGTAGGLSIALEALPQRRKVEVLEQVKAEGRAAVGEWLDTPRGRKMLERRAAKLRGARGSYGAIEAARQAFLEEQLPQWVFAMMRHRPLEGER